MSRVHTIAFRLLVGSLLSGFFFVGQMQAQTPSSQDSKKPTNAKPDQNKGEKAEEDSFAPEPAPPLPAGMTGSDAKDPRAKPTHRMYEAGELSLGQKQLTHVKKPGPTELESVNPDDTTVQKTLGLLGVAHPSKMPKSAQLVVAQLAFANSDLAFQGSRLSQGNFYGVNIYDISNPAKAQLLTSMICPGGQGDVSVYKNLMFMSVEQPNGRVDCGVQGFPPNPPPAPGQPNQPAAAQKDRFRGVRIFDIS